MITVYIASPYTNGDIEQNVRLQFEVAELLAISGFVPFPPLFSHYWHVLYPHGHEFWMKLDFEWVMRCDVLLRLGGDSVGADMEVQWATEHGKPVFFSVHDLIIWALPLQ
jgi:hypothetical protein